MLHHLVENGFISNIEKSLVARSGDKIPVLMSGSVMSNNDGTVHGIVCIAQDITSRKQAETALRKSEERHRRLFEEARDGIFLADADTGMLVDCNRAGAELVGRDKSELIGQHQSILHPPSELVDGLSGTFRQHTQDSEGLILETQIITSTGDIKEVAIKVNSIQIDNVRLLQGMFRDITDRKRAEEQLAMFREFAEASGQGLGWADLEGRIQYTNESLCRMFGEESRDDTIGKVVAGYYDQETQQRLVAEIFPTVLREGQWVGELDIHGANGVVTPTFNNIFAIRDEHGVPKWYANVLTDITARKRAEVQLQEAHTQTKLLLESISSILIGVDRDGRVTAWNAAAERTFGIRAQDAQGRVFDRLEIEWDQAAVAEGISECLTKTKPTRLDEVRFKKLDGTDGFLGMTLNPLNGGPDKHGGFLLVAADITEQKILQHQLGEAQKLESIGQLAAGIAHEINTPTQYVGDNTRFLQDSVQDLIKIVDRYAELLAPDRGPRNWDERTAEIKAALEELDIDFLREEIPKAIAQSLEGVERVARIVRSMKEFSHPGGDEKQMADLNKAIESTLTVSRNEWKYVAEMVTDFDSLLPLVPCLLGDFNQVILNMIVNAAHAITDVVGKDSGDKGTITISTRRDGDWVEIRVSDTGTGIPETLQSKVFDPFFTTKDVGKGTGQGLAIARTTVVKKHGGELSVESEAGHGTTFVIRLPLEAKPGENARADSHEETHSLC